MGRCIFFWQRIFVFALQPLSFRKKIFVHIFGAGRGRSLRVFGASVFGHSGDLPVLFGGRSAGDIYFHLGFKYRKIGLIVICLFLCYNILGLNFYSRFFNSGL